MFKSKGGLFFNGDAWPKAENITDNIELFQKQN